MVGETLLPPASYDPYVDHRGDNAPSSWEGLSLNLGGSFTARARGLVSPGLDLITPGNELFGHLLTDAIGGARFRAGGLEAVIREDESRHYVMITGATETLTAEPAGSPTSLRLRSGDRLYEAQISLFRNRATALSPTGDETARLSGGLTNRRYRVTFDPEDPASLPIATLLLNHTVALRSKAYRTG